MIPVLFVLTSNGADIHAQRARLAIASVRLCDPGRPVLLLCDAHTADAPAFANGPLPTAVDRLIRVETPAGDAAWRSRWLKTSMRAHVQGAFLFLDTDVLLRAPLSALDELTEDVAAVRNHNRPQVARQVGKVDRQVLQAMGWPDPPTAYHNTGVVRFADSIAAHAVGEAWHRLWQEGHARTGIHLDQPAFNTAVGRSDARIATLHDGYNAQLRVRTSAVAGAVLWHFFSNNDRPITRFDREATRLAQGGAWDPQAVPAMVRADHPWAAASPLDEAVVRGALRAGALGKWRTLWLEGRRTAALRQRLRAAWKRLRRG